MRACVCVEDVVLFTGCYFHYLCPSAGPQTWWAGGLHLFTPAHLPPQPPQPHPPAPSRHAASGTSVGEPAAAVFSRCRWCRCWGPPAPCCGAAWRGGRPPGPTSGCWTSCPPASSRCPASGPRPAAPAWTAAATACETRVTRHSKKFQRWPL